MGGVKKLAQGLLVGLIVAGTVLGALVLSVRGQSNRLAELPIPTVTLQLVFTSPTATHTPTALPHVTLSPTPQLTPSDTATPSPTPTVCPVPPDWQRYVVGPFDTFALIAQRFNVTPAQLMQANCLSEPRVTMGATIYVPPFRPTPTIIFSCVPPFNWMIYIVRPGDTLNSIAARYGTAVYTLMRANCLSSAFIYAGQRLYVPPVAPIVTFTLTPFVPTFTATPTVTPPGITVTPTAIPTTPVITITPSETIAPTDTPLPTDTPTPQPTVAPPTATLPPSDTPLPPPTEVPPASATPSAG